MKKQGRDESGGEEMGDDLRNGKEECMVEGMRNKGKVSGMTERCERKTNKRKTKGSEEGV